MMMFAFYLVAFLHCTNAFSTEEAWVNFKKTYNKSFEGAEEEIRFATFTDNLKLVADLNAKQGGTVYGVTKFMHMSPKEFRAKYLLPTGSIGKSFKDGPYIDFGLENAPVPSSFDWRSKNAVTPAYDQAQCGSCWAFSAVEAVESQWFLAGHSLVSLSPQQVVDCDKVDQGCNGGDTPSAYQYIINAGGLDTMADYPYTGEDDSCKFKKAGVAATIKGYTYITKNKNETEMVQKLYNLGPLSICVDAASWQFYIGGVVEHLCGDSLDHCVMITGYDDHFDWLDRKVPVWNIRNSWGQDWGYDGYLYVERNENLCGVGDEVTIPLVK